MKIAVSGKGGSGKTTIAGLIIRSLLKSGVKPILAVDADPNANLNETIGMDVEKTVGSTIAEFFGDKMKLPPGITKDTYLEMKLNEMLVEGEGIDLLVMGRGEGIGCYCYPNLVVRRFVDELANNYKCVVMDNQAGMEHLSRRTTDNIDLLLVVASPTVKGIRAAARILELTGELDLHAAKTELIINMASESLDEAVSRELERSGLTPSMMIPSDPDIPRYDLDRRPLTELPDDSPAVKSVENLLEKTGCGRRV